MDAINDTLSDERFLEIKRRVAKIVGSQSKVKTMNKEMGDMFWLPETGIGGGNSNLAVDYNRDAYGINEVRVTASTSSRDRVLGIHRMLRTTEPDFSVQCKDKNYANKIERALKKWWKACNEKRRAPLESELALSGILFADVNLSVQVVDDMLKKKGLSKVRKTRLEERKKRTPIWYEADSPMVAYPVWGDDGVSEYLTVTKITGRKLKDEWGDEDVKDDQTYDLYDYWNLEEVCTYHDNKMLRGGKHDLPDIPKFSAVTDGTDLFFEEEKKRQPFLYGWWKSGMYKRESELLTALFTSVFARGPGPLVVLDKSQPNFNAEDIELKYKGMVRVLAAPGKPQLADDKAFDRPLLELMQVLKQSGEQTTVPGQALGENITADVTFSGYSMAAQNGRAPIISVQEAVEKVIHDAAVYSLKIFKEYGIEWEGLKPAEIPDDFELTVKLNVDLPQDALRNAQTITQLKASGVPLSNEWIHDKLQIRDSKQMTFDVMAEAAMQAAFEQDLPALVEQILQMLNPKPAPTEAPAPELPPNVASQAPMVENEMQYTEQPLGPQGSMAGAPVTPAEVPLE